jgi:hypothetical protein
MRVEFFDGERLIGHSELAAADPPMGVASGMFVPTSNYLPDSHANTIDGDYVADRGLGLTAKGPNAAVLEAAIWLEDWQDSLQERHANVRIGYPEYEEYFSDDPAYRAYYRLDLPEEERAAQDLAIRAKWRARIIREWLWLIGLVIAAMLLLTWIF